MATYDRGVGVFSFNRFGDDGQASDGVILHRACKTLCHETGHMFNLKHCIFHECLMGGLNGLWELDSHPFTYCHICFKKFHSVLQFDMLERFRRLYEVCRKFAQFEKKFEEDLKYYETIFKEIGETSS